MPASNCQKHRHSFRPLIKELPNGTAFYDCVHCDCWCHTIQKSDAAFLLSYLIDIGFVEVIEPKDGV